MAHRQPLEDVVASGITLPYSGLHPKRIFRNLPAAALYELVSLTSGQHLTSDGSGGPGAGARHTISLMIRKRRLRRQRTQVEASPAGPAEELRRCTAVSTRRGRHRWLRIVKL